MKNFHAKICSTCIAILFAASAFATTSGFGIISTRTHGAKASDEVLLVQQRMIDLSYFAFKTTGTFGGMTRDAVVRFQELNGIMADGTIGEQTYQLIFSEKAIRKPLGNVNIPIGPTSKTAKSTFGQAANWFSEVDAVFILNSPFELTDLNTGKTLKVVRVGGKNHALIEPNTAEDAVIFLEIFGDTLNWSKRPVTISFPRGDKTFVYAASLQGLAIGSDGKSDNDFDGSCPLYFEGSRSETSNLVDDEHRRMIIRASGRW